MWRRPDGPALVATTDFFTPIVDDARTWGAIAGANAASDVYAMGARPLFALNLVGWPRDELPLDLLAEVLAGGSQIASDGGWMIVGGHTVDTPEPLYGQAVIGEVDADAVLTNAGGAPGEALVLTKPIGTGIVSTAIKRLEAAAVEDGGELGLAYPAAVASMTRLNAEAAEVALAARATACTDVTGFGLLGHLHRLAEASGVAAEVAADAVPFLPDVRGLLEAGYVPGGTGRNVEHVRPHVRGAAPDEDTLTLLADAQTSGGLLFSCAPDAAAEAVARLTSADHPAAVVGSLIEGEPGTLRIV